MSTRATSRGPRLFLTDAFGASWQSSLEASVPGAVSQAEAGVGTLFDVELLSLQEWTLGDELAGKLTQPILAAVGAESPPFRAEGRRLLHEWFPQVEDFDLDGANHMLQLQNPVGLTRGLMTFFERNPI